MSAFGYGTSYNTSWRGNTQTQNALTDPTYSVAPAMSQPNFAPTAGPAWENPALRDVGNWESSRKNALGQMRYDYGDIYNRDAWANPLSQFFQDASGVPDPSGLSKQNAMGSRLPDGTPVYGWAGQGGMNGSTGAITDPNPERGMTTMPDNAIRVGTSYDFSGGEQLINPKGGGSKMGKNQVPTNARELFEQIGGFDLSQLQRLSGGTEGFSGNFSKISQDYANAYANPNYGKRLWGQQDNYGGNSLSQAETKDWLQQSYGKLLGKMDANYLL